MPACTLCGNIGNHLPVSGADERIYLLCADCNLIFADKKFHLSPDTEKQRYAYHQNSIEDKGYVDFLNKAIQPALPFLKPEMKGLDYGCGHTPTLSKLLLTAGYECADYDPYFYPELDAAQHYDFIFATECFEHFFNPEKELNKIVSLLHSNGLLVIMTEQWQSIEQFRSWYYPKDPTHVCFYHTDTFNYIASAFDFHILYNDMKRVVVLRRSV